FSLPQSLAGPALRLIETTGGKEMPVAMQVDLQAARLWWVASGTMATGAKRTYRLEKGDSAAAVGIAVVDSPSTVEARFAGKARVRFKELKGVSSGPVFGQVQTVHEHVDLTAGGDKSEIGKITGGKVALVEGWDLRIWNVGLKSGYWLLDVNSSLSCASDSP